MCCRVKNSAYQRRYGDMCLDVAEELQKLWDYLADEFKYKFIPGMIGNFMQMCLVPSESIRMIAMSFLFSMMKAEFFHTEEPGAVAINNHFQVFHVLSSYVYFQSSQSFKRSQWRTR